MRIIHVSVKLCVFSFMCVYDLVCINIVVLLLYLTVYGHVRVHVVLVLKRHIILFNITT